MKSSHPKSVDHQSSKSGSYFYGVLDFEQPPDY